MNTDFLGVGAFARVEVLARLRARSRTPASKFSHPTSVQICGLTPLLFSSPNEQMLSRFLGRALNTISQLALARLVDRQIMAAGLGPDLDQGLIAGRLFGISDRVLRVLDRFPV
jgi:hypothetical protein